LDRRPPCSRERTEDVLDCCPLLKAVRPLQPGCSDVPDIAPVLSGPAQVPESGQHIRVADRLPRPVPEPELTVVVHRFGEDAVEALGIRWQNTVEMQSRKTVDRRLQASKSGWQGAMARRRHHQIDGSSCPLEHAASPAASDQPKRTCELERLRLVWAAVDHPGGRFS
jgi:hypothetical protein